MRTSLSFLASDITQLPKKGLYRNDCVEAVSFNGDDLGRSVWNTIWINIAAAVKEYTPQKVTFHFPMNNADYTEDAFVLERLQDAYSRACELGLAGMVVHSNRMKPLNDWKHLNIDTERSRVLDKLRHVTKQGTSPTWLGLENMPLVGNSDYDIDPLFCFNKDFIGLPKNVSIVWDICHATASIAYLDAHQKKLLKESLVSRVEPLDQCDFMGSIKKIRHWHFASFKGLNDPGLKKSCVEGVMPGEGDVSEQVYRTILTTIAHNDQHDGTINFEVQENDYHAREKGPQIINWAKAILADCS